MYTYRFGHAGNMDTFGSPLLGNQIWYDSADYLSTLYIRTPERNARDVSLFGISYNLIHGFCGGLNVYLEGKDVIREMNSEEAEKYFAGLVLLPYLCHFTGLFFYFTKSQNLTKRFLVEKGGIITHSFRNVRSGNDIDCVFLNIKENPPKQLFVPETEAMNYYKVPLEEKANIFLNFIHSIIPYQYPQTRKAAYDWLASKKVLPVLEKYHNEKSNNEMSKL